MFMKKSLAEKLVTLRSSTLLGRLAVQMLKILGADIPRDVKIGENFHITHPCGVVIHNSTVIGNRVTIFSCVTLGRADAYRRTESQMKGIAIEDDVVLGSGCKVLCKEGILKVGRGTVIGANAVLLQSTGEFEVWTGIPAKCIGRRDMRGRPVGDWGNNEADSCLLPG